MNRKEIARRLIFAADLPDMAVPGMPLIEIYGQERVLIENHQGVTQYGEDRIRIRVKYGDICVSGCDLELARMSKCQLVITGSIRNVSLCGGARE